MNTRRKEISALLSDIRERMEELVYAKRESDDPEIRMHCELELIELRKGLASLLETGRETRQREELSNRIKQEKIWDQEKTHSL